MASPQFSLSPSFVPPQQALHVAVFGLLFAVLASPYIINLTSSWFPSLNLAQSGMQLTHMGLLFHAVVFMAISLLFATYHIGTA